MLGWMSTTQPPLLFNAMRPSSYYSFAGGINWIHVGLQLLLQDTLPYGFHRMSIDFLGYIGCDREYEDSIQCLMHLGEHKAS